ncbi:MAG TPA: hypothetical protein VLA04_01275 [Verrucomicrobiae bacterium]|nr:hypothetical protein [Verrucomicrobiae bacterium]
MKFNSYKKFLTANPDLAPLLFAPDEPANKAADLSSTREWVTKCVSYIAVRPFKSLDWSSPFQKDVPTEKGPQTVVYLVHYHFKGEEERNAHFQVVRYREANEVVQVFTHLSEVVEYLQGVQENNSHKTLVVDTVFRSTVWEKSVRGKHRESIEFYRVPENFLQTAA